MLSFLHRSESALLEPLSSLTHLAGALAALAGLLKLVDLTEGDPGRQTVVIIYGMTVVLMFAVSAIFHGLRLPERERMWLNRLDHAAIFMVIAGTYTPIVYILFPPTWRWPTLAIVWLVALTGTAYKLSSRRIHGLFNTGIYPVISWAGLVPGALAHARSPLVPDRGLRLLLLGGIIYMVGFVVYYRRRPDPWPQIFGHHEIWHLSIIAGSAVHYLFMLRYVV